MITLIRFFIKLVDNNINMIYNIRAKRQRRNTMTKEEMRKAWMQQWDETKKVLDDMKSEYEMLTKIQNQYIGKHKYVEGCAMQPCLRSMRMLIIELEDVLYKEV